MKRINRKQIKLTSSNKPHDGARRLLTSTPGAIIGLIALLALCIAMNNDSVSATSSTISLAIDNSTVSMSVSPTNVNGSFNKSSVSTISASTDNATGYTLSISAPSGSGTDYDKLINGSDNTAKLNSISSATTEEQFKALNNTSYNGKWGYLPSKYCSDGTNSTCADNTSFLKAPTTTGDVLDVTTAANSTPNEYTIAIGARVDSSVKSGAYTNAFLVTALANPITYSIFYNDTTITNMPADINTGISVNDTVNISNSTPTKKGYTFIGWCTVEPTTSGLSDTCAGGTAYQPNATYTLDQTSTSNTLGLYTMWKRNTMQNVSEWKNTLQAGDETTAVDTRDGNIYTVAKLCMSAATHTLPALNTCDRTMLWMTQNLDLLAGPMGAEVLTSADSDINTDLGTTQGYSTNGGVITWTPGGAIMIAPAYITSHTHTDVVSTNLSGWTNSYRYPYQAEGGDYYVYTSGTNGAGTIYANMTTCLAAHSEEECRHYHIGNYYNWSAAVAMNDSQDSTTGITTDLTVAPNSVCPKGWRLPNGLTDTGGNEIITEFNQLGLANGITEGIATAHSIDSDRWVNTNWATNGFNKFRSTSINAVGKQAPMYFVRSGNLNGTTLYYFGTDGYLWSSTVRSSSWAYSLEFSSGGFLPASQDVRYAGFPVRCVAREN